MGTRQELSELPVSTVAWLIGASTRVVRDRLDQFVRPSGGAGARMNGGVWMINVDALRAYMATQQCRQERLMMLERVVERTAVVPHVARSGPPPPLSSAILSVEELRSK